jgi:outer membrane protein TolC
VSGSGFGRRSQNRKVEQVIQRLRALSRVSSQSFATSFFGTPNESILGGNVSEPLRERQLVRVRVKGAARRATIRTAQLLAALAVLVSLCGCTTFLLLVAPPPPLPVEAAPGVNTAEHLMQLGGHADGLGYSDSYPAPLDPAPVGAANSQKDSAFDGYSVPEVPAIPSGDLVAEQSELTLNTVIEVTLATHPSLESAIEVWQAALQRPDQVSALPDPTFRYLTGVQFFDGFRNVDSGSRSFFLQNFRQRYQLHQNFPAPGKRATRGDIARAEAAAASHETADVELELLQAAKLAYVDYLTNFHKLSLHGAEHKLLQDNIARLDRIEGDPAAINVARQQVLRQLRELKHRSARLLRDDAASRARLNVLLNRDLDSPIPPPRSLTDLPRIPNVESLRQTALERRPELAAQLARISAAEHSVRLARLQYLPDYYLVGRLDSIDVRGDGEQYRPQLGVYTDLPIRLTRRKAAIAEAEALLRRNMAILRKITQQIELEVQLAFDHIPECWQLLELAGEDVEAAYQQIVRLGSASPKTLDQWQAQLDARRAAMHAQSQEWSEWREFYHRLIILERAAGVPLLVDTSSGYNPIDDEYFQRRIDSNKSGGLLPIDLQDIQSAITAGWPFRSSTDDDLP